MTKNRKINSACLAAAVLAGGTMFGNGCMNALLSITPCGTIVPLTVCTPVDQLNLVFPLLEIPDFRTDPSCTIPFGCGDRGASDLFPTIPGAFGGGASTPPTGGTGGGGGGGGGT
jgi:hypothetical protein